jgi:hypothetical protein
VVEIGYEQHPVVGVTWYGAVKYANWLTIDQGLPLESRCYTEADGTNIEGWHPVSIGDADWATRDLDAVERQDYVQNYLGYRLPMDQGGNNVDLAADSPDAFNEWLKFASFDPNAPASIRSSPSGKPVAPSHWTFGFGRDLIDDSDANSRCSADPFEAIENCLDAGTTPTGFYDGSAYNPGGNGAVGNGVAFTTTVNENFYSVFDVSTNVREWLQGRFDTHPQSILRRTIRGGSWRSPTTSVSVEAVFRNLMPPGFASDEIGFRVVRSVVLAKGDTDADADVDAADFAILYGCLSGPDGEAIPRGCAVADLDGNGVVDLIDVAILQSLFTGSGP